MKMCVKAVCLADHAVRRKSNTSFGCNVRACNTEDDEEEEDEEEEEEGPRSEKRCRPESKQQQGS